MKIFRQLFTPIILLLPVLLLSCKDDDNDLSPADASNLYVDSWIKEQMDTWYFWNTTLPTSKPDGRLTPDAYFESLLNDEDRFSWIQENYQDLLNSLKGISEEAGYEFVLYKESEASNNVIAQVTYVKKNSPAAATGLKRGDVITKINGQQMTVDNYRDVLEALGENHSITYKAIDLASETFAEPQTLSLNVVQYSENPNFLAKIIPVNDRKIGYYVYNFFAADAVAEGKTYDDQMDSIFNAFQLNGITDLVLDLRYNSGGSESSAKNLASLIGKNINSDQVFARKQYNAVIEDIIIDEYGEDFLTSKFAAKSMNVGSQLMDGRVYILTSTRTASASELVINALKPYMDVFIIGNITYGKNVGSVSLYEENDPKNTWGMQPIVVKIFNSLNQSDYTTGFTPNILDKDNSLMIRPLGDPNEALLKHAIDHITGVSGSGRMAQVQQKEIVGHSLDLKRRGFNLIIDDDRNLLEPLMKRPQ
jgi:carboxyl-terminal processing protease